jgi:hypothetical protein
LSAQLPFLQKVDGALATVGIRKQNKEPNTGYARGGLKELKDFKDQVREVEQMIKQEEVEGGEVHAESLQQGTETATESNEPIVEVTQPEQVATPTKKKRRPRLQPKEETQEVLEAVQPTSESKDDLGLGFPLVYNEPTSATTYEQSESEAPTASNESWPVQAHEEIPMEKYTPVGRSSQDRVQRLCLIELIQ